jgi:hypothetical protein
MVMKSIIPLSVITVLATLALVGCNQSTPASSTDTATNAIVDATAMDTNLPATNSLPDVSTNVPVNPVTNLDTNTPASTNQ